MVALDRIGAPAEVAVEVAGPLGTLLPEGLRAGSTTLVEGSTSLALALVAGVMADGWAAGVGWDGIGLAAAHELGVPWGRLVLAAPEPAQWGTTVSALLEAFDVVLARPAGPVAEREARRLAARARERRHLLVVASSGGSWGVADARLRIAQQTWRGLQDGRGYLMARWAVVEAGGRGRLSRPRRLGLWLPGPGGAPLLAGELTPEWKAKLDLDQAADAGDPLSRGLHTVESEAETTLEPATVEVAS